ncbi:hypothetical protein OG936_19575 [Streptomyces sp. NBC_00846]|uniref:hypothetical protein n=1 Tax=Streptomyces sp. NBC_00846 TaxID=2975849 RepID=UPI003865DB8B|nr:hypothetical protein OG936_19575 [Streptomyces sp. NBC_00846]
MRAFARAAATAALAVTAVAIPLTGTAMAAPAHSPVQVHSVRHFDDRCADFDHRRPGHNGWDRRGNRWTDDCRNRSDHWGAHRSHWNHGYESYRDYSGYGRDYARDCYRRR